MKITSSKSNVRQDEEPKTVWYEISKDALLSAYQGVDPGVYDCIDTEGMLAINLDELYCSAIRDDVLYYGSTDGKEIEVDGEMVDPAYAIENFDIDKLQRYIKIPTNKMIRKFISSYELDPELYEQYDGYGEE